MKSVAIEGPNCFLCGLDQEEDIRLLMGDICPCCGIQYNALELDVESTRIERQKWIKDGYPWFQLEERPKNWNPNEQLNQIPLKYR